MSDVSLTITKTSTKITLSDLGAVSSSGDSAGGSEGGISSLGGDTTGDPADNTATTRLIRGKALKEIPHDNDLILIADSEDNYILKAVTLESIRAQVFQGVDFVSEDFNLTDFA